MAKRKLKKQGVTNYFEDAILLNNRTYIDYLERMKKIALSMFEWVNLPETCNARFLEMCLYYKGQGAFLYDEDMGGYINTMASDGGYINLYGLPSQIMCYSYGNFNQRRNLYMHDTGAEKGEECILVMNTYERIPTASSIELFAKRLAEAQRTIDINMAQQRTPMLILTDKNQEFTLRNMYAQYDGNSPVIFADKNLLTPDTIKAIKTDAQFLANDIMDYKVKIWDEFLTFMGLNNLSEKKERLITSEANSNNEVINLNLQALLAPRKKACEQFNEKYGLMGKKAIDVKVRSDLYNIIKQFESVTYDYDEAKKTEEIIEGGENV